MAVVPLNCINRCSLPPEIIIDNFIKGHKSYSYEDYLTELINSSALFLRLSGGEQYKHTPKGCQSHGEWDCCAPRYKLDFKIFGTKTSLYAGRNLSPQKVAVKDGVILTLIPLQRDGMEVTLINNLCREYALVDLEELDLAKKGKMDRNNLSPDLDMKGILSTLKCNKNILLFHRDYVFTKEDYPLNDVIQMVETHTNKCLENIFHFRDRRVKNRDTYLAMIINGFFCIANWDGLQLKFCDVVPLSKSSVFCELYDFIDQRHKAQLKIGETMP